MKTMNKLFLGLGFCAGLVSCSDFDEVNTNPTAAGEEYVKPQYALNNSIGTGTDESRYCRTYSSL